MTFSPWLVVALLNGPGLDEVDVISVNRDHRMLVKAKWNPLDPISEPDPVSFGTTTEIDDDSEDDQTDNSEDLDGRSDKLGFSIPFDAQEVDRADQDEKDRDPDGRVDLLIRVPVGDDDGDGG